MMVFKFWHIVHCSIFCFSIASVLHASVMNSNAKKIRLNCSILIGKCWEVRLYCRAWCHSFCGGESDWCLTMHIEQSQRGGWGLDRYGVCAYGIHGRLAMEYTSSMGCLPSGSMHRSYNLNHCGAYEIWKRCHMHLSFYYVRKWNWYLVTLYNVLCYY